MDAGLDAKTMDNGNDPLHITMLKISYSANNSQPHSQHQNHDHFCSVTTNVSKPHNATDSVHGQGGRMNP